MSTSSTKAVSPRESSSCSVRNRGFSDAPPERWWALRRITCSRRARSSSSRAARCRVLGAGGGKSASGVPQGREVAARARRRPEHGRPVGTVRWPATVRSSTSSARLPARTACLRARLASSSPRRVARARSSVLPRVARCSSRASSPRRQADSTPPVHPRRPAGGRLRARRSPGPDPSRGAEGGCPLESIACGPLTQGQTDSASHDPGHHGVVRAAGLQAHADLRRGPGHRRRDRTPPETRPQHRKLGVQ